MLLQKEDSCLLLVDVQEKLTPLIRHSEQLINRCEWLMHLANDLAIPCLISEQYPKGLGATLPTLQQINTVKSFEKVYFSCGKEESIVNFLVELNKKQIVLIGIEAHVCVLQTAFDLKKQGFNVYVVTDAVGSREEQDYKFALKRMLHSGIHLVTSEMVFFEWVEKAGNAEFKALSNKYLK